MRRFGLKVVAIALCVSLVGCAAERYAQDAASKTERARGVMASQATMTAGAPMRDLSIARVDLGRKLFHDTRLSADGKTSCASCHMSSRAYTIHAATLDLALSPDAPQPRNPPSLYDVALRKQLLWDGRSSSLKSQAMLPLTSPHEMRNISPAAVAARIRQLKDYNGFFQAAFDAPATPDRIARALAAYQTTLITGPNRFDLWRSSGDDRLLSAKERAGYRLFNGKAGCAACHSPEGARAAFTDDRLRSNGYAAMRGFRDVGRMRVTGARIDKGRFRTPGLRNIALTGPYMHDGSLATLQDVVAFYDKSRNLNLTADEQAAVVSFLEALTSNDRP